MVSRIKFFKNLCVGILFSVVMVSCVTTDGNLQLQTNTSGLHGESPLCGQAQLVNKRRPGNQGLNPENIAFLNWNIYKGNGEHWQQDLNNFAGDHDVMTIQEAFLDSDLSNLLKSHELDWVMNTAFYLDGTAAGVMTVANSIALHSCGFKTKEPIIRIPKATLVSYYTIAGYDKKLLVANIHGINFTLGMVTYQAQLDELYAAIKYHDGPMIMAGDFNSWSDDRMQAVNHMVKKLSLLALKYSVNNKKHVFGNAIDHVFYRQLEPVGKKVWQVSSSDHNPISVNFRLKQVI